MKVGFIHDHQFIHRNDKFYTTGGLNKEVWSIYFTGEIETLYVFARECRNLNISATESSRANVLFQLSQTYNHPRDFFFVRNRIKKEIKSFILNCDCVIIRLPSFLGLLAVDVCKANDKAYAIEVVGNVYDALSNYGKFIGPIFASYVHRLNQKAILNAPFATYVTKCFLQESYPCKNTTSYASDVNISEDENFSLSKRLEKIESLDLKNIVIGQIGNVDVLYKGYEVCLKALNEISMMNGNINFTYCIAGSGKGNVIKEISKKYPRVALKLEGKLDKQGVLDFLDKIDLYVHPSFQEGLSRAIIEALSRGCPSLTSDIGGTPELIEKQYMHRSGDYAKLRNDIYKAINDKAQLESMAIRNFNHSRNYLDIHLFKKRREFWRSFYKSVSL